MVKVGARLRTRLGLAWPGSGSVSHSALFGAGLARSLAQLGSVLTSVHYSLLVSKLNVISPDQFDSRFGSAQLGDRFGSVRFSCLAPFGSKLSSSWLKVCSAKLEDSFGQTQVRVSDRLGLGSRVGTRLSFVRSSDRHLGSEIGSVSRSTVRLNSKALLGTRSSARS